MSAICPTCGSVDPDYLDEPCGNGPADDFHGPFDSDAERNPRPWGHVSTDAIAVVEAIEVAVRGSLRWRLTNATIEPDVLTVTLSRVDRNADPALSTEGIDRIVNPVVQP